MIASICGSQSESETLLQNLKLIPCPHCKAVGTLNRHGVLKGYQEENVRHKTVRAQRVFCSNRNRARGCGRTFSVWIADKVKRLFLSAEQLWGFLKEAARTNNKRQAFAALNSGMSDSAPYRIWKRFQKAQAAIRTTLCSVCTPPQLNGEPSRNKQTSDSPADNTLAHLVKAFGGGQLNPIAAYQLSLQTFFL